MRLSVKKTFSFLLLSILVLLFASEHAFHENTVTITIKTTNMMAFGKLLSFLFLIISQFILIYKTHLEFITPYCECASDIIGKLNRCMYWLLYHPNAKKYLICKSVLSYRICVKHQMIRHKNEEVK